MNRKIISNLFYGICAQILTFLVNIGVSFLLPHVLGVEKFAYWQLFIFYTGYVCFFHFGLPDGIYLLNGGKQIEELDKENIAPQFRRMLFMQSIVAVIFCLTVAVVVKVTSRKYVIFFTAIYLVLINFNNFYGMIYQAVNKAKWYSTSLIIDKIFFGVSMIFLFTCRETRFEVYILAYCIGRLFACIYSFLKCKELLCAKRKNVQFVWRDILSNIKVGSNLMLSVISSSLILGVGRAFIDKQWGIETFGIFSFSLMLSNFILQFINQISIVLFPSLRNVSEENLKITYQRLRSYLDLCLGIIPMAYIPLSWIVNKWLPQYGQSIRYLAFLLPIAFFDGKMQMLSTTYFKVLRKEKLMFAINTSILVYSSLIMGIGTFVFRNIGIVMIGMISGIVLRSIIAEKCVNKILELKITRIEILEILNVFVYWCVMLIWEVHPALVVYGIVYVIVSVWNYQNGKEVIK